MSLAHKRLFKRLCLMCGFIVIIALLILGDLNKATINNELMNLDIVPKPEKLTELYFSHNAFLPTSATIHQEIHFTFIIHNLETTDYQYIYNISVYANGQKYDFEQSHVYVKNAQYYAKDEKVNLINVPGRQKVVVELVNKQQAIYFWVDVH